jgi:Protein O-mannosyl-transferase TMEM260-like
VRSVRSGVQARSKSELVATFQNGTEPFWTLERLVSAHPVVWPADCSQPPGLMNSRFTLDSAILIAATALTRFAFRSRFLYDIDSVNFALALRRFDPAVHQPHPPGYFLYVRLGILSNSVFHDANTALVAISILASCGTVAMIHRLASTCFAPASFGRAAAGFAGLLFVFSPLAWFHGTVALTYIVEAFFSALIGYFCWRVYGGARRFVFPAAAALGLAAGFRQSSLLVLAPLFLFSIRRVPRRLALGGVVALGLVLMAWWIPMLDASGGIRAYASSLWSLWRLVPARQTVFTSPVYTSLARLCLIVVIYGLCFGCAALLPLSASKSENQRLKIFTWIWLSPGLLLFTFVYLKFVNSGYLLVLMPPACIWLGFWAATWYRHSHLPAGARVAVLGAAAAINCAIFFRAPLYFSYRDVQRSQHELAAAVDAVRQIARPRETIIVGFDSHFLGYRHAGYYLPEYLTIQFPEVPLASTTGVFVMQHQDTRLVRRLQIGSFQDFILFPLPSSDNEYREYLQHVRERFPAGALHVTAHNGLEFLTGPVSALPVLFPNAVVPGLDTGLDPRVP